MNTPEGAIVVGLIAAVPATMVGIASLRSSKKNSAALIQVHTLVNSRLTTALEKIERLEFTIQKLTGKPTLPETEA